MTEILIGIAIVLYTIYGGLFQEAAARYALEQGTLREEDTGMLLFIRIVMFVIWPVVLFLSLLELAFKK